MMTNEASTDATADFKFTDEQLVALLGSIKTRPDGGASECELEALVNWAQDAQIGGVLLELLLARELVVVGFEGTEPRFGAR